MKQTVTIGDTTLLVNVVIGWYLEQYTDRVSTVVVIGNGRERLCVLGDHRAALDAAVNDPARQSSGCSLVTHGGE